MDFEITPAHPDGVCVHVEFLVETWGELSALMRKLERVEAEV